MSIDAMYQKLADSELAKTLTADDKQHEHGDKNFVPSPLGFSLAERGHFICCCIRCKTIRALRWFVDKHDDGKQLKPGMSIFLPLQFVGVEGEG
jgi:hypothetical protein